MSELFLSVLNMSITAGWLVIGIVFLRFILKKAPKWIRIPLWGMVAFRLICPISVTSILSIIPSNETVNPDIMMDPTPGITSGIPAINHVVNSVLQQNFTSYPGDSINPLQIWIPVLAWIWMMGLVALGIYAAITYTKLNLQLREATKHREHVYFCDHSAAPFVLGFKAPKIYLPYHMDEVTTTHVLAHEESHIQRKDHWWKLLGFILLTVHWFNPLIWVAYVLLCKDIELACDEKVIRLLTPQERADYSQALLACSIRKSHITACPLAFGEGNTKGRIKSIMQYKAPKAVLLTLTTILCILAAVCFLTNPATGGGIGIQSIYASIPTDGGAAAINLDYFLMEKSGFRCRHVPETEGEYIGDGMIPYDGALGKYRIIIEFGDMEPSESFRKQYQGGQVYTLENVPKKFKGTLKFKIAHPQDHGFVIYIGSDVPFAFKEPPLYNYKYIGGTLQFKLYRVAEPIPEETYRMVPGAYVPVSCVYRNPDLDTPDASQTIPYRFHVKDYEFAIENLQTGQIRAIGTDRWHWNKETGKEVLASFGKGTSFYASIQHYTIYHYFIDGEYHLIKVISNDTSSIYLVLTDKTKNDEIQEVFLLAPETP